MVAPDGEGLARVRRLLLPGGDKVLGIKTSCGFESLPPVLRYASECDILTVSSTICLDLFIFFTKVLNINNLSIELK